jgi:hypothetical protein
MDKGTCIQSDIIGTEQTSLYTNQIHLPGTNVGDGNPHWCAWFGGAGEWDTHQTDLFGTVDGIVPALVSYPLNPKLTPVSWRLAVGEVMSGRFQVFYDGEIDDEWHEGASSESLHRSVHVIYTYEVIDKPK